MAFIDQNVVVNGVEPVDRILPGKSRRNTLGGGAKAIAQVPVKHQLPHALVESLLVALGNNDSILVDLQRVPECPPT